MDVLSVVTDPLPRSDGVFVTRWRWRAMGSRAPIGGQVAVALDERYALDRPIIAELGAIHYLLEKRQVRPSQRLGKNLLVEVSFGAIRKALLKGALKSVGRGDTEKGHVASAAAFLARKYFAANIAVRKSLDDTTLPEPEQATVEIGMPFPKPTHYCKLVGSEVQVTLHAMNRYLQRIDANTAPLVAAGDIRDLPDKWWSVAWHWFGNVLSKSKLRRVSLAPAAHEACVARYGPSTYLLFPDAKAVLVLTAKRGAPAISTVLSSRYMRGLRG
jgi:hypothetical protein